MKSSRSILFLLINTFLFVMCLYVSHIRHNSKNDLNLQILYLEKPLILNDSVVNKLLTQNLSGKLLLKKDDLDLNILENQMKSIPEVENVEFYIDLEKNLFLSITERKPLFKVESSPPYFSDSNGILFKYKSLDSSGIPSFKTSSSTLSLGTTAEFIKNLKADVFLNNELETIFLKNNKYEIKLKSYDFKIIFGRPTSVRKKIKKLKVFCAYTNIRDSANIYTKINLSYDNQIVASTS
ncbi:hypothetical protein DEJ39_07455 [Bacteroidetes bacterium SCGC AAA795-G10]|nr:hypothetical protein DEJ39_07455 [Bacteroidetes bacterium SCGC AAA795-G10]